MRPPAACLLLLLGLPLLAAGCSTPPPQAYAGGQASAGEALGIGRDASNEACTQQARTGPDGAAADVFCGTWTGASAHVERLGPGGPEGLAALARSSAWRSGLETRFACTDPAQPTTVLGQPAILLSCARRVGGWPQVALATSLDGAVWVADGIQPALPVIPRAIAVLAGRASPDQASALPASGAEGLLASRLAAQAFSAGDIGQYEQLMLAGTRANLAERYADAERAFRAALEIQRKAAGRDSPDQANALMHVALQVSNQGHGEEAGRLFAQVGRLAPQAIDPSVPPRLLHYRALHAWNNRRSDEALLLFRQAEAGYARLLPPEALTPRRAAGTFALARTGAQQVNDPVPDPNTIIEPTQQNALIGLVETRRYQAIVLRDMGRPAESEAAIRAAAAVAASQGMRQPILTARLLRTAAAGAGARGELGDAETGLGLSSVAFVRGQPGTRPLAATEMLRARRLAEQGRGDAALQSCRRGAAVLRDIKAGVTGDVLEPCLGVFHAAAERAQGPERQRLLTEMFEASQLAQGGITSQQIAEASARLGEGARDPRVGAAIRRRQDAVAEVALLEQQRDTAVDQARGTAQPTGTPRLPPVAELEERLGKARAQLADADASLQAASPNYGQLVQEIVPAEAVLAALRPGEAFASVALGAEGGWVFLLRDGAVLAAPLGASPAQVGALVRRVRAGVEPGAGGPGGGLKPFDTGAAQELYAATLGRVGAGLEGASDLVVVPTGPLLSIPFGLLLTGPADGANLAGAPWLVKRASVAHVPAAANFVTLRRIAGTSRARRPWFGLGDFRPVPLRAAERTFPGEGCTDSARLLAGLPALPFARRELEAARALMGASTGDELLGAAYTVPAVAQAPLGEYRVLHFASHALLPAELRCVQEPAVVTSVPGGVGDAAGALLTASKVAALKLDADAVILSACNSAGPQGPAGESLSGLARAFFFAGARAMLVTHWSVSDQASAFLVADTLRRTREGRDGGLAGSLRAAQLGLLAEAGRAMPAEIAHPFYWAPFALIGEGGGRARLAGS